jgi:Flp pilus assembly protein TadD
MKNWLLLVGIAAHACACLVTASPVHPEAERLNSQGASAMAEGRMREARVCFELALEYGECNAEVLHNLGVWHLLQGQYAGAARWEEQALACRPDLIQALCGLGVARWRQGDPEEARALFLQALHMDPGSLDARRNLVWLDLEQGRAGAARAQLERLLALSPDDPILQQLPEGLQSGAGLGR